MKYGLELEFGMEREREEHLKEEMEEKEGSLKEDSSVNVHYPLRAREINTKVYNEEEVNDTSLFFSSFYKNYVKEVNNSCGLHIHVSFEEIGYYNALFSKRFIRFFKKKLLENFQSEELKKRFKNKYCKCSYPQKYMLKQWSFKDRYKMINFLAHNAHRTVEFRIFDAPKTAKGVIDYLNFTLSTIREYLSVAKFDLKTIATKEELPLFSMNLTEEIEERKEKIQIRGL